MVGVAWPSSTRSSITAGPTLPSLNFFPKQFFPINSSAWRQVILRPGISNAKRYSFSLLKLRDKLIVLVFSDCVFIIIFLLAQFASGARSQLAEELLQVYFWPSAEGRFSPQAINLLSHFIVRANDSVTASEIL